MTCLRFTFRSAKSFLHQGYQFFLSFVSRLDVVNKLSKLNVTIIGEEESLPSLAEKINELGVMPGRDGGQPGVGGCYECGQCGLQKLSQRRSVVRKGSAGGFRG